MIRCHNTKRPWAGPIHRRTSIQLQVSLIVCTLLGICSSLGKMRLLTTLWPESWLEPFVTIVCIVATRFRSIGNRQAWRGIPGWPEAPGFCWGAPGRLPCCPAAPLPDMKAAQTKVWGWKSMTRHRKRPFFANIFRLIKSSKYKK